MKQIRRSAEAFLLKNAGCFPVVTILGPRQSGKTTLARQAFPSHRYVNLEDPEAFRLAQSDMTAFFSAYGPPVIVDEIQRMPELLRKIQVMADSGGGNGRFVLTGSFQQGLKAGISQSLAGRTGIVSLLPLSIAEVAESGMSLSRDEFLYRGFMPRIYGEGQPPDLLYPNYFSTYAERDLQQILRVKNLSLFEKFFRLLSGRIGQVANIDSLANDTGVSSTTISEWLSVLESSFLIFRVEPYFRNYTKRLVKSPKIYFTETGLAAFLLGIRSPEQAARDPLVGSLFENMVALEILKAQLNGGGQKQLYYFRDSKGFEVDLLVPCGQGVVPVEIKSAMTFHEGFAASLKKFMKIAPDARSPKVIYAGETEAIVNGVEFINFRHAAKVTDTKTEQIPS